MADLYDVVERLGNLVRAEERAVGQEMGLQPVHLHVLRYLRRANRFSDHPAAVTEYLGQTKGTVSQSLRLLEQKGLVERTPDPEDGRRVHLHLTAPGRRTADRLVPRAWVEAAGDPAAEESLRGLLAALLASRSMRSFGTCATCRFHVVDGRTRHCGLLDVRLTQADATRICREHEAAPAD